jgi:IS30 family transposase
LTSFQVAGSWQAHTSCAVRILIGLVSVTRFTMLVKLQGKDAAIVATALSKQVRKPPFELRRSLTWDRGMEMAEYKRFTIATDVNVYFCDPQSPWQRGTNENTNRLLRQYFPKGTNLLDTPNPT